MIHEAGDVNGSREPVSVVPFASPVVHGGALPPQVPGPPPLSVLAKMKSVDYDGLDADTLSFKEVPGVGLVPKTPIDVHDVGNGDDGTVTTSDTLVDDRQTPKPLTVDEEAPAANGNGNGHLVRQDGAHVPDSDASALGVTQDSKEGEDQEQTPVSEYASASADSPPRPVRGLTRGLSVHFAPTPSPSSLVSNGGITASAGQGQEVTLVGEVVSAPLPVHAPAAVCFSFPLFLIKE